MPGAIVAADMVALEDAQGCVRKRVRVGKKGRKVVLTIDDHLRNHDVRGSRAGGSKLAVEFD
jgi:hypothetical protein